MDKILQYYLLETKDLQTHLETVLERNLSLEENNAIRNFGSGMMLESFYISISNAKTKEEANKVLGDLIKMERLDDYIIHYNRYINEKGIKSNENLDSLILRKGNCIDLMLLMNEIEDNKISSAEFNEKVNELIEVLIKNR